MQTSQDILCIGSVLWDMVGRTDRHMKSGADVPGRIETLPGGVALNIAMTLSGFGLRPALLSVVGDDAEGHALVQRCVSMGLVTEYLYRSKDLPTDRYMAIEGANGLVAAIADAHSLEAAGDKILSALSDGRLGSADAPFEGVVALDGNLTTVLLAEIARSPLFAKADLRIAPASPGKAERLMPLISHPNATFYVNREEASILCQSKFEDSASAAKGLVGRGLGRVLVTDGGDPASEGTPDGVRSMTPPPVLVTRVTGAGDTFMAAHIAAELRGETPEAALQTALNAAAAYVCGETE
ncbi:PfkB family carbohydrate kinase [Actibacterium pelagium]|uniref:Kinase n=1 Tax=Actibacterium pelagium TaxID=2029103 RepID=A0A917ADP3_9RHOB|nr:PfkB family carbohydrate kinase [Actibacterium pelagium]GGE42734.1 kinase [Actibacterium pelagium]